MPYAWRGKGTNLQRNMDEAGVGREVKQKSESKRGLSLLPDDIFIAFPVLSQAQLPLPLGSSRNIEY